eukprot:scaffold469_cov160-Amphora_coffeaeformis.AAC.9
MAASAPSVQPEHVPLDVEQQAVYNSTLELLRSRSSELFQFFVPLPAVVAVPDPAFPPPPMAVGLTLPATIITPTRGHVVLGRLLEELEGLEKQEATLVVTSPLSRHLMGLLLVTTTTNTDASADTSADASSSMTQPPSSTPSTPEDKNASSWSSYSHHLHLHHHPSHAAAYPDSTTALQALQVAGKAVPRRVCQHPFRKNDIVWVCRTCQADETCVLCHACFSQSHHEGHDVAFYHAQAGGCCDCGDPDGTLRRFLEKWKR